MGWPGASLKGDQFLSFWNREPIADNVGNSKDFHDALKSLLHAAKGDNHNLYESKDASIAVVIGHSFGGIVLEHAATGLIQEQVDANCSADQTGKCQIDPPADLFLLINEAGAAAIARPFLREIQVKSITYTDNGGRAYPLLISMTSTGDVLTKFAYPGGEFLSFNRPKTEKISPPDPFGQTSTLPYNLLTAANMIALQSHSIEPWKSGLECELPIQLSATKYYCMNAIKSEDSGVRPRNQTPYWIMQLPQIFVPDHGAVFQDYLLSLMEAVMFYGGLTQCGPTSHGLANHHALFRQNLGLTPPQPSGAIGRPTLRKAR
jgi:hypothetical protein